MRRIKGKHKEKVALLETILEENKSKRKLEAPTSDSMQLLKKRKKGKPSEKKALKKIQLGWLHYDEKQKRFVAVRQTKGGGTRDVNFTLDTTADEIIEMGKMLRAFVALVMWKVWNFPLPITSKKLSTLL